MHRTTAVVLGLVLLGLGLALLAYRTQGGAELAEPLPIVITIGAVAAILGGLGALSRAIRSNGAIRKD
ncbi:hypothetical protein BCR15_12815 [Tessaracoccus lapidicaptus]|uniref:Uncharacterized protein n=1 Tax=Tessaracoccus lapidicaptus TaxID=1427523 RepID=A0A1C0ARJ0_9ACTN|nr:hypothetical protein [Tessaracoccus lapidicaptus]OCL36956.1 hypothetical protein BCR15_12815 [Tessaracoccus lapidicaptus]